MASIRFSFIAILSFISVSCLNPSAQINANSNQSPTLSPKPVAIADSFAYPVSKSETVTQRKDKDTWYNALDFGQNYHLGEDWNLNTGGNTDCGEPVYAAANGFITYARDAGTGWGNVVMIEHTLPSGEKVQSLYGHMLEIMREEGEVKKREQIGKIGNANGYYPCHLHFEMRTKECPMWNQPGPGYARDHSGWVDPSDFIDSHR